MKWEKYPGNLFIESVEDNTYLWACVYADLGDPTQPDGGGVPGYTIVMPGNPYGN